MARQVWFNLLAPNLGDCIPMQRDHSSLSGGAK